METLLVIGGAFDFSADLPDCNVVQRPLQNAKWLLRQNNQLFWLEKEGALRVDAVLWRVGAIRAQTEHRHALEMIRLAGVPCLNPARTLLRGFDRLSMLAELREIGVPVVPFECALGENALQAIEPDLPCVLKVGNWHGGIGKARLTARETWEDARDLALTTRAYSTIEPYLDYARDIRVMVVGDQLWAMERRSRAWKVNRGQAAIEIVEAPAELATWTRRAQQHLGADMLGLDWIQTPDGAWRCLESNDVPGLTGWPDAVRNALITLVRERIRA